MAESSLPPQTSNILLAGSTPLAVSCATLKGLHPHSRAPRAGEFPWISFTRASLLTRQGTAVCPNGQPSTDQSRSEVGANQPCAIVVRSLSNDKIGLISLIGHGCWTPSWFAKKVHKHVKPDVAIDWNFYFEAWFCDSLK